MSLFRVEKRTDYPTDSLGELYRRRQSPLDTAGVPVDADTALRHSAVFACVDLIASMLSTLPLDEFRGTGPDKQELPKPTMFDSPDGELELNAWLYQVVESMLRGNAYGLILTRDRDGWPARIQMVDPGCVQVSRRGEPLGRWQFKLEGKPIRRYDWLSGEGDLWHTPAYLRAGTIIGMSPIEKAAMDIGIGLAAKQFGGQWFRDSATPAAVLTNDKPSNKTAATLLKERWMNALLGNREPVVLADGWKYQAIQVTAEESQFLATMRASVADVARFYRVPVSEINGVVEGDSDTYANQEQRALGLLTYTLAPWMVRLERSLSGLRPRGRYVKLNTGAFLRTDLMTRYKAHDSAIRAGWKSPDEVRAIEDLAPIPDDEGEKYLWPPMRMQLTMGEMGSGDLIEGGVDNAPEEEGGAANNGASQGTAPARS